MKKIITLIIVFLPIVAFGQSLGINDYSIADNNSPHKTYRATAIAKYDSFGNIEKETAPIFQRTIFNKDTKCLYVIGEIVFPYPWDPSYKEKVFVYFNNNLEPLFLFPYYTEDIKVREDGYFEAWYGLNWCGTFPSGEYSLVSPDGRVVEENTDRIVERIGYDGHRSKSSKQRIMITRLNDGTRTSIKRRSLEGTRKLAGKNSNYKYIPMFSRIDINKSSGMIDAIIPLFQDNSYWIRIVFNKNLLVQESRLIRNDSLTQ